MPSQYQGPPQPNTAVIGCVIDKDGNCWVLNEEMSYWQKVTRAQMSDFAREWCGYAVCNVEKK